MPWCSLVGLLSVMGRWLGWGSMGLVGAGDLMRLIYMTALWYVGGTSELRQVVVLLLLLLSTKREDFLQTFLLSNPADLPSIYPKTLEENVVQWIAHFKVPNYRGVLRFQQSTTIALQTRCLQSTEPTRDHMCSTACNELMSTCFLLSWVWEG